MYRILRPLIFGLNPESAHSLTLRLLQLVGAVAPLRALVQAVYAGPARPVEAFGLRFRNPVGLAAGYDKDGLAWRGLAALGFGHIEIGTVTPKPQPGNPKPRLFRLPQDRALINRLGFPGRGADFVARRLAGGRPPGLVLGVNIGKNKDTPIEAAAGDYVSLLRTFAPLADYLAVNVSSPNTLGLRRLQARAALEGLLAELEHARASYASTSDVRPSTAPAAPVLLRDRTSFASSNLPLDPSASHRDKPSIHRHRSAPLETGVGRGTLHSAHGTLHSAHGTLHPAHGTLHPAHGTLHPIPLLVKLSPDLTESELDDALEAIVRSHMDGVIASNTTITREGLRSPLAAEGGGLSGAPLAEKSTAMVARIVRRLDGALPVVAVGGVIGPQEASAKLDVGAALVQVYTGLIYAGPGLVKAILEGSGPSYP